METAYKITSREQLKKFNERYGLRETKYPALYININGEMTCTEIEREDFLRTVGYKIISM